MTKRNILIEADKLLLKHEVTELPLTFETLERIANRSGWLLAPYQHSEKLLKASGNGDTARRYPAFTMRYLGKVMILYDEEIPYEAKVQIICHEFGHIVLNHTSDENIIGLNRDSSVTAAQENEADDFATEMLAPACVMKSLGISSASGLMKTGLLTAEQALAHWENVISDMPLTETEKFLCDRMLVNRSSAPEPGIKASAMSALKSAAVFLAGIVLCAGVMMYRDKAPESSVPVTKENQVTEETSEPTNTEPETSEVVSTPTPEQPQPESTSSAVTIATTPLPQTITSARIITQPPITVPPQTTATPSATPKATQTTSTTKPQREPIVIPSSETVYITSHYGTKYHKPDCYHISGKDNLIELSIPEAEKAGYEQCKDCF